MKKSVYAFSSISRFKNFAEDLALLTRKCEKTDQPFVLNFKGTHHVLYVK